jgi:hypothetical protein
MSGNNQIDEVRKNRPSTLAIIIEVGLGLFGIYGVGHLFSRWWLSGILLFLFSFVWLFIEGITKDVFLRGNYPAGLCALVFHAPIIVISLIIIRKPKN